MTYGLGRRAMLLLVAAVTLAHAALIGLIPGPKSCLAAALLPLEVALQATPSRPAPIQPQPAAAGREKPAPTTGNPAAKISHPVPAEPIAETARPAMATGASVPATAESTPTAPERTATGSPSPAIFPPRYQAAHLDNPAPDYPPFARRRGWQGIVKLKVRVLASGRPTDIRVQTGSGFTSLDEAAIDAVQRWRFIPAQRGNVAIDEWVLVPVEFRLRDEQTGVDQSQ